MTVGCEPTWPAIYQPDDHPPTPLDNRAAEMHDLRHQGPGPHALWTATTIPTGDYL